MRYKIQQPLYLILLLVSLAGCSGSNFPDTIKNSVTEKQTNIPGTRLYVTVPEGYSIAGGYMGLRKSTAVLQVYDNTDGNFFTSTPLYNREKFEREGAQVTDYKDVTIDGYKGKYIFMKNSNNTSVYTLVFGDSTFCTTVLGVYPDDDEQEGKELKGILQSIAYNVHRKVSPFSRAAFTIDDTVSAFKFAKLTGSAYIFTPGGKDVRFNDDVPYVIISSSGYRAGIPLSSLADTTFKTIEDEHAMTAKDIKNAADTTVNNYIAYEREVYGVANGKLTLLYELALAKDKTMVIFTGHSKSDFATNLVEFRNLAQTIEIK